MPDPTESHDTLDDHREQNVASVEKLIAEAMENEEISPALKKLLTPVVWYMHELHREVTDLTAPLRWVQNLKEKALIQAADQKAWETFIQEAHAQPFRPGLRGSTVWFVEKWTPPDGWSRVWDAQDGPMSENRMTIWANPSLRSIATEHEDGRTFIEHFPSTARFTEKMQSFQGREAER